MLHKILWCGGYNSSSRETLSETLCRWDRFIFTKSRRESHLYEQKEIDKNTAFLLGLLKYASLIFKIIYWSPNSLLLWIWSSFRERISRITVTIRGKLWWILKWVVHLEEQGLIYKERNTNRWIVQCLNNVKKCKKSSKGSWRKDFSPRGNHSCHFINFALTDNSPKTTVVCHFSNSPCRHLLQQQ